jgi:hypothetical protein
VANLDSMFVDVIRMYVMQMAVVEVIDMATMAHGRVAAAWTMLVGVIRMMRLSAARHGLLLSLDVLSRRSRSLEDTSPMGPSV